LYDEELACVVSESRRHGITKLICSFHSCSTYVVAGPAAFAQAGLKPVAGLDEMEVKAGTVGR